jgi:cytochrome c oxidase subunit 4
LVAVWVALCALTVLNLLLDKVHLHGFSVVVSLAIASVMAIIAAMYFMHLRYDHPFYLSSLILVVIFITIFIVFSAHDTLQYKSQLIKGQAPAMVQAAQVQAKTAALPATTP